jgi:Flp pilus assembly protein TadD
MGFHIRSLHVLTGGILLTLLTACETASQNGFPPMMVSEDDAPQKGGSESTDGQAAGLIKLAADIEAKGEKKETALTIYERAVEVSGHSPAVMVRLGDAYLRAGQKSMALKTYRAALASNPTDGRVLLALGTALAKAGDASHGVSALKTAATILKTATAYDRLGVAYTLTGQFNEAREALETAHELAFDNPDISTNLALVLALIGENRKAAAVMQEVLDAGQAQPHHWRNLVLILAIGGQAEKARKVAGQGGVPDSEARELVKRGDAIRAVSDPKARGKALGIGKS